MLTKIVPTDSNLGAELDSFWQLLLSEGAVIKPVETVKFCDPFEVRHNAGRAKKIGAVTLGNLGRISPPSSGPQACRIQCQDPSSSTSIINRRCLGILGASMNLSAAPNLFPGVDKHLLLLPAELDEKDIVIHYPHIRQTLDRVLVSAFLSVAGAVGDAWAIGYNDVKGAAGSVDHAHLQLVKASFPVEKAPRIKMRAGLFYVYGWPAGCVGFDAAGLEPCAEKLWLSVVVDRLQQRHIPFNLLVRNRTVFVFGRKPEYELTAELPSNPMAWMELSGKVLVSDQAVFDMLNGQLIAASMRRTTLPVEELLVVVG